MYYGFIVFVCMDYTLKALADPRNAVVVITGIWDNWRTGGCLISREYIHTIVSITCLLSET